MENTELRLTPRAVELLEELDEKGLAYEARGDWPDFVKRFGDTEAAKEVRSLLDELQCELVYNEHHDAIAIEDLPWATVREMKKVHKVNIVTAPFEKAEERAIASQAQTGRFTGGGRSNIEERTGAPRPPAETEAILAKAREEAQDDGTRLALLKENVLKQVERSEHLTQDIRDIQVKVQEQERGLSFRNVVQARADELVSLINRSESFVKNDKAAVDTGNAILDSWEVLRREIREIAHDLVASENLLKTKDLAFPFAEPREGQLEAATESRDALVKSDIVACAPTGFGKSAYILSAVSGFEAGAYVITPQRVLVKQYQDDFEEQVPWVGFYRSRASFRCRCDKAREKRKGPPEDWPTCSDFADACTLSAEDEGQGTCPYAVERDKALSKPVVVMTAAMATTMMLYQKQRFPMRAVLAVDECQRFEDTLMSACTTSLKYEQLKKDGWLMENDGPDSELLAWPMKEELDQFEVRSWLDEWSARAKRRLATMNPADLEGQALKEYRRYDGFVQSLNMAFMFDNPDLPPGKRRPHAWLHETEDERFKQPEQFVVKPLSAIGMLDDIMGDSAARKMLVSATPGTPEYIQDTLGLKYTPAYFEYGSSFPVENRPVVYNPVVRLNYKSPKEDYQKLTDMIVRIATDESEDEWTNHAHQKGIIHTVSNKLHKTIVDALRTAKQGWRIREVKGSYRRLEIMDEFMASNEPLIMVGPAITDGVSLKGDQCRWGIITKLPWPPPVDPAVAYRKDSIPDWYVFQVVLSVIQACGRNVRSKDDWAVNYVLDAGFGSLIERNRHLFPDWFIQAIVTI